MSTGVETRGVSDFGATSPGTVSCLYVINRISIAAVFISVLAHLLFFSADTQHVLLDYQSCLSDGVK